MTASVEFLSLEIENIFAYQGLSTINLSDCTGERNIVVISGNNGAGKTGLLSLIQN
ncbi:AAA family ATPase [Pseudomonas syringae]|nr:AAA family ATPase [Pseudomonas syringae]